MIRPVRISGFDAPSRRCNYSGSDALWKWTRSRRLPFCAYTRHKPKMSTHFLTGHVR